MATEQKEVMSYEAFERDWLKRHKGSMVARRRVSSWGLLFGLILWGMIAIGAALVSGAHSVPAILLTIPLIVPTPWRETLSLFGFTIFELLVFAGALYRRVNRYAAWGLMVALAGALAANIGSSIHAVGENNGDWLALIVALILALIAPLAAFLAGEMVHHLYAQHQTVIDQSNAKFDEDRRDLDTVINREYAKYSRQQTDRQTADKPALSAPSASVLSEQTDSRQTGQTQSTAFGYNRSSDGQAKVIEYLTLHPDKTNLPSRQLAPLIGVGHDTANKGRNAFLAARAQMNGHGVAVASNGHHSESNESTDNESE